MIGVQKFPVVYDYRTNAWMPRVIFSHWNTDKRKKSGKMLLVIGNVPHHPKCELLDRENGLFKGMILPTNTSWLVQPVKLFFRAHKWGIRRKSAQK
ncbi:hypothetical protein T05_12073 [Trichinella murrelli]|uniref:DDE-1 domain-containing protein n=1 Tax=Trichinella murrelli TaxID=144512 RepID=A0A0V0T7D6_9BILA|nr:hypothetical protein T05_12073 [Trichinella murrelli]